MWPFSKKKQLAPPAPLEALVYVREDSIPMDANDAVVIAMVLSNRVGIFFGVTPPAFPYITERQYHALPDHCRPYFVSCHVQLEWVQH